MHLPGDGSLYIWTGALATARQNHTSSPARHLVTGYIDRDTGRAGSTFPRTSPDDPGATIRGISGFAARLVQCPARIAGRDSLRTAGSFPGSIFRGHLAMEQALSRGRLHA